MMKAKTQLVELSKSHPVVLYDGVCHLCHRSIQFILQKDKAKKFRFAPLQARSVQEQLSGILQQGEYLSSVLLFENEKIHKLSDASLRIISQLAFPYSLSRVLLLIPGFIRNGIYRWIAKNRYRWFGKEDHCILPNPDTNDRFLFLEELKTI